MNKEMRLKEVASLVNKYQFKTVNELSYIFNVSDMTIRRDLEMLHSRGKLKRIHGGAISLVKEHNDKEQSPFPSTQHEDLLSLEKIDVIITSSANPYFDNLMVNRAKKNNIPIIAESIEIPNQKTIVSVNNYQAGYDLGKWTQKYFQKLGSNKIHLLDLTFHQPNTLLRSQGFIEGLKTSNRNILAEVISINAESGYESARQVVQDALFVHPLINVIFAINDITALGALDTCRKLEIDPSRMTVLTFGIEGNTLINEIMSQQSYCKAGLAMFPEIVGRVCMREAIAAYNQQPQKKKNITPHAILTRENLDKYYTKKETDWVFNWDYAQQNLDMPDNLKRGQIEADSFPKVIGHVVPFSEHDWYKNLTTILQEHAKNNGIDLQVIDADVCIHDEIILRRSQIAKRAAAHIKDGDVLIIDSGPIAKYLANELKQKKDITIITNSVKIFDSLNGALDITLISTGGVLRSETQTLVGPIAELALHELRADKLFLMVSGITLSFGLLHHTISEVTIKQAMIKSAREIIVIADHTAFIDDVGIQVTSLDVVDKLITDDALPASVRLNLSKKGIHIEIV